MMIRLALCFTLFCIAAPAPADEPDLVIADFEASPGGSERLDWHCWDVADLAGRKAVIQIVDQETGGWGHINIDQIVQSNRKRGALPDSQSAYRETYRPQFHFSPRRGWTNDPNGLVYYDGEYHLFFQHNPFGVQWGNMTWGHAVSRDLVHWTELGDAIHPDRLGTIFSGSAVVDEKNSAGFQTGKDKVLVCIYTAAGGTSPASSGQPFTQSIAFSNDRGRTWTKYAKNPVLGHVVGANRDPKVVWHEPTGRWIMALFLDGEQYALFGSPNLTQWSRLCDLPKFGASECPDFFELPVDGNPRNTRWVFWGANGNYLVGRFDGRAFSKESGPHRARLGANDYAAQTYSGIPAPDGRRIQIAWMAGGRYPGMPFNQQMSVPRVLTLRTTPEGIRMFAEPVHEIEKLRGKAHTWQDLAIEPGKDPLTGLSGELFDIQADIDIGQAKQVGLDIRGHKVEYSVAEKRLAALGASAPLAPVDGRIRLRILVDRTSVEIFANDGRVSMASCFLPSADNKRLGAFATGMGAKFRALRIWEIKSIWQGNAADASGGGFGPEVLTFWATGTKVGGKEVLHFVQ